MNTINKKVISEEDFSKELFRITIASCHGWKDGKRCNKEIIFIVNLVTNTHLFVVYHGDKCIDSCNTFQEAVLVYNKIGEESDE